MRKLSKIAAITIMASPVMRGNSTVLGAYENFIPHIQMIFNIMHLIIAYFIIHSIFMIPCFPSKIPSSAPSSYS